MRGDIIYQVYGVHDGRDDDVFMDAFSTLQEAQAKVESLKTKEMHGQNWAARYHNKGFVIREQVVDTDFEIPPKPKPRDKYVIKALPKPNKPGTWNSTIVEVYRRDPASNNIELVCKYERNYEMLQTFEPFRQGDQDFALISSDYTSTSVLDLSTGEVIAQENTDSKPKAGFCPVGFYVPDWWDVNDGSIIPGSNYWSVDEEWPIGEFGFVWGCYWGDDLSWKVQYLDLSQIRQGVISRQERFGYVELATHGFENPCFTLNVRAHDKSASPQFINLWRENGTMKVTFAVEMRFDLISGAADEWQRVKGTDFE